MPKGSPELTEKRKNEIIDACENVYKEQGFQGVNIKEISTATSMTRPSIYNYFETKEEILLGLLIREYEKWTSELQAICQKAENERLSIAHEISHTLENKDVLLRILNMNLFEIEINSRVERLAEFKKLFLEETKILDTILHLYKANIVDEECEIFSNSFNSFLFGVYPFTRHTDKQMQAMKMAGMELKEPTVYDMVNDFLVRTLPDA